MPSTAITTAHRITILFVLLVLAGCNSNSPTQKTGGDVTLMAASTVQPSPIPSITPLQPSPTTTSPPPTPTHTATSTLTATFTPTSEPASLGVNQDVACRTGPGLIYDIRAYLPAGTFPILLGQNQENTWWTVEEPAFSATCWVSDEFVTVQGNLDGVPVLTPEPTPTLEPTATPEQKGIKVYLVALNTGGPFGCGDGLVYYYTGKKRTGDVERDISSALNALLKIRTEFVGNYYNPTHNAHLHVKNVEVNHTTGRVVVYLEGSIPKPADVCEAKRVHDQVWETARQISGYRDVGIHVGNKLLGDLIAVGDR